ncbi:hypothetical protein DesLBE_2779 [Desulfitobacterium sp. LBE]|uniref:Uncharacterized protein n=3 Tax=Desulfitobacterium hafniense TaxID=49338 RepID=A0A098AYB2_DESHA|nr:MULTISPECIES: hypothetical protein [Desulfitobacterium]ACL18631.1 hypothetical protein Dhaf_0564 [Desulfitobacterium hafniense DCB-2]EHL08134.1 hypothetical protein HMPREF0322_01121 [Desulfitobacterium hafniense DP7]KTE91758.1 hypothetical protein AT727_20555 [Desulfitobacterium hafniense]TWH58452.1 hypothetical protein DesLBE_2779 [Desulfitobacterium sp. LBE]CDX00601.1 Hypothetical protein DPCES_0714 [Desulfitobacterium hafniense]
MYYTKEEINTILAGMQEGKTYAQIMDEMHPRSELLCLYDCAEENMRSFSLIGAIYNAITKKGKPKLQNPYTECLECADCL